MPEIILRDDQQKAIESIEEAFLSGCFRQIVCCPCGWGKTIVFSKLAYLRDEKTLILVQSLELVEQTVEKLRLVWPDVDVGIVDGTHKEWNHQVVVATVQSCYRVGPRKIIEEAAFRLVICDEAHRFRARTAMSVIEAAKPQLLVGFTATPYRADGKGLKAVFDRVVFERGYAWAIANGLLSPVKGIAMATEIDTAKLKVSGGDYTEESLEAAVNTPQISAKIVEACKQHCQGRKSVLFGINIKHACNLTELLREAGFRVEVIHSNLHSDTRAERLQMLKGGKLDILCNVGVLIEGFDDPSVDCCIMARPTKSQGLYIQATGRALRLYPGKADALILDCTDTGHKLCSTRTLTDDQPGIEPRKGKGEGPKREKPKPKGISDRLKIILKEFDPLASGQRFAWKKADHLHGRWQLEGFRVTVDLSEFPSGWIASVMTRETPSKYVETICVGVSFDIAFHAAEEWARRHISEFRLADNNAAWKQDGPTDKQLKFLKAFGYKSDGIEFLSRGQAAGVITMIHNEIKTGKRWKPKWYKG